MTVGQIMMIAAFSFAGALPAFISTARERGWPYGNAFARGEIAPRVSIICSLVLIGKLIAGISDGTLSWLWILSPLLGLFIGGPIVINVFRRWSGLISLVGAPMLTVVNFLFK